MDDINSLYYKTHLNGYKTEELDEKVVCRFFKELLGYWTEKSIISKQNLDKVVKNDIKNWL